MAELVRWDPFQEMLSLRDAMNQLVAESFVRPQGSAGTFQPRMDLYEEGNEYVVKLAVPGLKPDNFEITLQQNVLTIRGRTQEEKEQESAGQDGNNQNGDKQKGRQYHVREHRYGEFLRTIQFPVQVDPNKVQATLSDGVLTIRVPKTEAAMPKRIQVQVEENRVAQ
jgi:HSP20 family protein